MLESNACIIAREQPEAVVQSRRGHILNAEFCADAIDRFVHRDGYSPCTVAGFVGFY